MMTEHVRSVTVCVTTGLPGGESLAEVAMSFVPLNWSVMDVLR
jgi:hypothetical protein